MIDRFSHSGLSSYEKCPAQFRIRYIDRVAKQDEGIEAFMGKLVHEVLEWLYNRENMEKSYITFDRLCQVYDEQWITKWHNNIYIADTRKKSAFYYSIGKQCLSNYYSRYGPTFDQQI